jgi:hypothetical protein
MVSTQIEDRCTRGNHAYKLEKKVRRRENQEIDGEDVMWKKRTRPNIQRVTTSPSPPSPRGNTTTTTEISRRSFRVIFLFSPPLIPCAWAQYTFTMDVVAAVSGYISKMVTAGESASGSSSTKMKILLLDSETVGLALD